MMVPARQANDRCERKLAENGMAGFGPIIRNPMALIALAIEMWYLLGLKEIVRMDLGAFDIWLSQVSFLTAEQRGEGFRALAFAEVVSAPIAGDDPRCVPCAVSATTADAVAFLPRLPESDPVTAAAERRLAETGCPPCGGRSLQRWGRSDGLPRHRCKACRRTFNGLTGTSLARLRKKDRWAAQTEAMVSGESLAKAAKRCGVAPSTAFRWRHRFLQAPAVDKPAKQDGVGSPTPSCSS